MDKHGKTRNKTDYNKGKIYKIISDLTDKFYIGSTSQKYLCDRLNNHKSEYNRWLKNNKGYCSSFELIKLEQYKIILIESYSCNSKAELQQREQHYIDKYKCDNLLNIFRSFNSLEYTKEYKKDWEEKYGKDRTEYYKNWNNREEVKLKKRIYDEKQKEKITCICGCIISKNAMYLHKKSKKHIKLMTEKE
jgi:hypothetical protein